MADIKLQDNTPQEEEQGGLSLKEIWTIVVLNWYWIIISLVVFLGLAFGYLRYARPVYATSMKVLIKDDDNKNMRNPSANALDQLGIGLMAASNGFDNELEILTSTNIAQRVVDRLKLYVRYAYEGRVSPSELYRNTPLLVDMDPADLQKLRLEKPLKMMITRHGHGIRVVGEVRPKGAKELKTFTGTVNTFPGTLRTPVGTLIFQRNPGVKLTNQRLIVSLNALPSVAAQYAKQMTAAATSKTTTVAALTLNETQPERAIDYLNELVACYNTDANEDKNEVGRKTEQFIKARLDVIKNELDSTEKNLEKYKQTNELINLPNNATTALAGATEYQKQSVEKEAERSIVGYLNDYLQNPSNASDVIPANMLLSDQGLNKQIATYNEEIQTLNRLLRTEGNEQNPIVVKLNNDIEILWDQIGAQVKRIYADMGTQQQALDQQYGIYSGKVENTPAQERMLVGIQRQQEVKANLYLMLLQKREENYISLASVASKARIIDSPRMSSKVSPKTSIIYLVAGVAGLVFPIGLIWVLSLLRYRIEGRPDVEKLTKLTILADIPLARKLGADERAIVVHENRNGTMEEAFRGLRTNMRFVLTGDEKVLIVTSVIPGEGKTFVSTNLAMSLAFMGKKVIIVGLDVRKPMLVALFGLDEDQRGITTYLSLAEPDFEVLDEQITHGVQHPNLDILPAGVIPPNPGELISRDLLDKAIDHLRTLYDYVILDTPPIGLVSDTLEMGRVADASFIVARADYSPKSNFSLINSVAADERLPKMNLVLNGIDLKKRKYGYYYGYGNYGRYGRMGSNAPHYGHYVTNGGYGGNGKKK